MSDYPEATINRARGWAHSIPPVDLGSAEGIRIIAQAIDEAEERASAPALIELQARYAALEATLEAQVRLNDALRRANDDLRADRSALLRVAAGLAAWRKSIPLIAHRVLVAGLEWDALTIALEKHKEL